MLGRILKPRNICRTSYRNLITIVPYITPKKGIEILQKDFEELFDATKKGSGCLFYDFTYCEEENKVLVREGYKDVEAVRAHLGLVGPILGKLIESGNFTLDRVELHGTQEEIEDLKQDMDPLGTKYFVKKGEAISIQSTVADSLEQVLKKLRTA